VNTPDPTNAPKKFRISFEGWIQITLAFALAGGWPWWWPLVTGDKKPAVASDVVGITGGCEPFRAHAQNRWAPVGAAVRAGPNVESRRVRGEPPNMVLMVDGWVHSRVAYPTNPAPWNSDIWYHLADNSGWVSFAGVRANPTSTDSTGLSKDGGTPARLSTDCEGSVK
jgi:hypothetical protein